MDLFGRRKEQAELEHFLHSNKAEFIAVFGRRRVGKTYLIKEFFKNDFCFYLTGSLDASLSEQLALFDQAAAEYSSATYKKTRNWNEAFRILRNIIENSPTKGKKVVFLDELPWLATKKSGFLAALEHFWNSWGASQHELLLIVCGSASSWMADKLINDTGGLHNRLTGSIHLQPFSLGECEQYCQAAGLMMSRYQMMECYMVFGGIPYYLSLMRPNLGLTQNIDALCFEDGAILRNEFDNLYKSLFRRAENHIALVRALSNKGIGLTRSEIEKATKISDGGRLTKALSELVMSGFVRKYKAYGKSTKGAIYQLMDSFSIFFLKFMDNSSEHDPHFWSLYSATVGHSSWSGFAFERVALMHIKQIRDALGISGVLSDYAAWQGTVDERRAQIDLVISRSDGIINLCEMKYTQSEFAVDKAYDTQLRRKRAVFECSTKVKSAIHQTLITTYGLERSSYSSVFQSVVTADDLFKLV